MAGLTEDELEFIDDLDDLVDRAQAKGVCSDFIRKSMSDRGADIDSEKFARRTDLFLKIWVVIFCSLTSAAIWGWKFYASMLDKKFIDDPSLNAVCLIGWLAIVASFFNLKSVLPILDRLLILLQKKKR